jgi:hypothetical protein
MISTLIIAQYSALIIQHYPSFVNLLRFSFNVHHLFLNILRFSWNILSLLATFCPSHLPFSVCCRHSAVLIQHSAFIFNDLRFSFNILHLFPDILCNLCQVHKIHPDELSALKISQCFSRWKFKRIWPCEVALTSWASWFYSSLSRSHPRTRSDMWCNWRSRDDHFLRTELQFDVHTDTVSFRNFIFPIPNVWDRAKHCPIFNTHRYLSIQYLIHSSQF